MFACLKISAIVNIDDVVFIKRCLQFKASNDFEVWITIEVCPVDYILTFFKLKKWTSITNNCHIFKIIKIINECYFWYYIQCITKVTVIVLFPGKV